MAAPQIIAGKYELRGNLGQGAMGVVREGVNLVTGRRVAIKVLDPGEVGGANESERLVREARAAGSIQSRHIAQVLDAGMTDDCAYIVLECLRGVDLAALLARVGSLETNLALRIVGQACKGLHHAHASGILHRDIKPANIFVAREHDELVVKLLDFGLAKALVPDALGDVGRRTLTSDRSFVGTPLYMSPEQARSAKTIDARSDLWSLGVVLYEALIGRTPHEDSASVGEIILAICGKRIHIAERAADVPSGVAAIVDRALDIDPSHRFQDASEMLAAIVAVTGSALGISVSELESVVPRLTASTERPPIYDGETIAADGPTPASARIRTLALASSQVIVETTVRDSYVLATVRGRMSNLTDAHTSNAFIQEALETAGLRAVLIDARRAEGTKQGHSGLWDWIRDGRAFDRLAMLVESSALRRGFDAEAIEANANARAFEDLTEAETWLRSP